MLSQDSPDDDEIRQSYNFAPGYYGLVYRADVPDHGTAGSSQHQVQADDSQNGDETSNTTTNGQNRGNSDDVPAIEADRMQESAAKSPPLYKLQAMKWGLIPFWTKRNPDYGTLMRTINCRDDSLASSGGMWQTMKQRKRCIVIAQGFFEWLKKNEGKDKIPHYIRRKDGQLMCFAGLWDCVKYEGSEEKTYTYTIITTDCNQQISFLHDRMPVILDNGSKEIFTWLDANRSEWNRDLQALLKPYKGELEIYPVTKDMNKTGTSSATFIIPIDSAENKQNIANFFGAPKSASNTGHEATTAKQHGPAINEVTSSTRHEKLNTDTDSELNAPIPVAGTKREREENSAMEAVESELVISSTVSPVKVQKTSAKQSSPSKSGGPISSKRSKSATSNAAVSKVSPTKPEDGNKKITNFFGK